MTAIVDRFRQHLAAGEQLTLDAGTGTELETRGAPMHPKVWCGVAHMSSPDITIDVHRDYIRAGADIITANTFSSSRNMMAPAGLGDEADASTRKAVELALKARDLENPDRPIAVAGSMSHQVPMLKGTKTRNPDTLPNIDTATRNFRDHATALRESGVDLILLEMMSDPDYALPAMECALDTGLPVWVGLSARHNDAGELVSYTRPELSFEETSKVIMAAGGEAAGIMHSALDTVLPALDAIRSNFDGPLMAYPDSGHFVMPNWQFETVISPNRFVNEAQQWIDYGAQIIGGCCGMGIAHIDALPPLGQPVR